MIFTRGERRLLAAFVFFLAAGFLVASLREARLLPPPASGSAPADTLAPAPAESTWGEIAAAKPPAFQTTPDAPPSFVNGFLDLNAADSLALVALPGIGPALCARILAYRAAHGRFSRIEELLDVKGIGPKRLADLRPYLTIVPAAETPAAVPTALR